MTNNLRILPLTGDALFKNGTMPEIKQEPMDTDIKVEVDSADEDGNMMLGPSVLGLLRVGESPIQSPQKNQVVLNRRGMVSFLF